MQKHQWRQHGIVHAKLPESLPPSTKPLESIPIPGLVVPSTSACLKDEANDELQLQFEEQPQEQPSTVYVQEPATISIPEKNSSDVESGFLSYGCHFTYLKNENQKYNTGWDIMN